MRSIQRRLLMLVITLALLAPISAFAAATKTYQVTGKVLAMDDKTITVEKGDEKWEIERSPALKLPTTLKVGDKVTITYKMIAQSIEPKPAK